MSESRSKPLVRRILIAMDASPHSQAALHGAAHVASLLGAELMGVFVEDINLLRVAQLPFVREIRFPMAEVREIEVAHMEKYWQTLAAEARRQLTEVARVRHLHWTFEVVRGSVAAELLAASLHADMLALGRLGRSLSQGGRLGSTARRLIAEARSSVLLMRSGADLEQPVLTIYDGTEVTRHALTVAAVLAKTSGYLRVLIWSDDNERVQELKSDVINQLQDHELEISFRRFYVTDRGALLEMFQESKLSLLVLGDDPTSPVLDAVRDVLEDVDTPVLVFKQARENGTQR